MINFTSEKREKAMRLRKILACACVLAVTLLAGGCTSTGTDITISQLTVPKQCPAGKVSVCQQGSGLGCKCIRTSSQTSFIRNF